MNEVIAKHPGGRPPAKIDWVKVEELTVAGCLGSEIAGVFGIAPSTLYEHVEKNYGIKFSEFRQQFLSKGDAYIRASQYKKALKGDNSMLIWLGKNRLGQSDKTAEEKVTIDDIRRFVQASVEIKPGVDKLNEPRMAPEQPLLYQESPRQENPFQDELGTTRSF